MQYPEAVECADIEHRHRGPGRRARENGPKARMSNSQLELTALEEHGMAVEPARAARASNAASGARGRATS